LLGKLGYAFDAPDPLDPTTHVRSILAYTRPLPVQVSTLLFTPELNIRPDGGGRLVLQSLELDSFLASESDLSPNGALARAYLARLASIVPFLPKDAIHELRIGRRSMTGDGLPAVGWLRNKVYLLATHSGVTLAPALAELAGEEILLNKTVSSLAPFRPTRLVSSRDGQHLTPRLLPSSQ
jgi:glycine/D-amino acid oxidase-like deaminating enzyme